MVTGRLLGVILILPFINEVTPEICSCYTINENGLTWPAARKACQYHGGDLVSMETEHEWQVVKDHIQNRTNRFANDWYIGLRMNASGNWTWVSGKPLTINRWNLSELRDDASFAVMARNNTPGTKDRGVFKVVKRDFRAGFICERPSDCSASGVICNEPGKKIQIRTTVRGRRSTSSQPPTRQITTLPTTTTQRRKTDFVMVEKAQPPSGYIHWTVAVIPLSCVIVVLICLLAFLLWRLTQRPRKQNGSVTVHAIHYDVQTKSILNPEGSEKNSGDSNHIRVRFQEPDNREAPKCPTLKQAVNNTTGGTESTALNKVQSDCSISRRLAIRRKSSEELERKYPLNKDQDGDGNKTKCADSSDNTSYSGDHSISRRLAIRRKSSEELQRKYPLNMDGDGDENKTGCADSSDNTSYSGDHSISRRLAIRRKSSEELQRKYPLNKDQDGDGNKTKCADSSDNTSYSGDHSISRRLAIRRKSSEELQRKYPLNMDGDGDENKTGCADSSDNTSYSGDHSISRRLAIRRKSSEELQRKYPLNKDGDGDGNKTQSADSTGNTSYSGSEAVSNSSQDNLQIADYTESNGVNQSKNSSTETPAAVDSSEDELSYLKTIP